VTLVVESHVGPQNTDRIAGWLVIPAFGLILSLGKEMLETWSYNRTFVGQPTVETAIILGILVPWILFCLVVAGFFFRKHRWAPYFFIAFLIGNVMFGGFYLLMHLAAPDPDSSDAPKEFRRALVPACIWIPYFLRSRRVRLTFVRSW
jgi:hypothetical protein